jgi:hypothetical protein
MDGIREFLDTVRSLGLAASNFRGLLHITIGRKVSKADGTVVSTGLTWRELSALLKLLRFDKDLVREIGADPDELAPRDRQRFWYSAIALAHVDSAEALADAEQLASALKAHGYVVGPAPALAYPRTVQAPELESHGKESGSSTGKEKADERPARRKKKG